MGVSSFGFPFALFHCTNTSVQGTLVTLAITSLLMNFKHTSPYGDLIPPLSIFPFHPIQYVSEWISTYRLHVDYTSAEAARARAEKLADVQKRRLYRRAHGLEDLDVEEGQGVDIRGLVDWDDGLTNPEREALRKKKEAEAIANGTYIQNAPEAGEEAPRPERRKVKKWLGIW